jgi:hypothetical protein
MPELTFAQCLLGILFAIPLYIFLVMLPLALAFRAFMAALAIVAEIILPILLFPVDCLLRLFPSAYRRSD